MQTTSLFIMAGSYGTGGMEGMPEGAPDEKSDAPKGKEAPDIGADKAQSVMRLVHSAAAKVQSDDILEQKSLENIGIRAAFDYAGRFDLDLSPLRQRIQPDTVIMDAYRHIEEYVALIIKCLEVGPKIGVIHPDEDMRKAAKRFAESMYHEKESMLLHLQHFRTWLRDQREFEECLSTTEMK